MRLAERWWWLAPLAAIVGAQAFLLSRQLDIKAVSDEGNYVLSMQALEHGETLGKQIFISQPPGFFLWLRGLAFVFGDSLRDMRMAMILTVAIAAIALYVVGRKLVGVVGGLAAAAMLAITAPLPTEGAQVYADTPSYALGAVAVACAASRLPFLAGIAVTAALSCKFSGVIAIPTVIALVYVRSARPWRALAELVGGALALAAVLALVFVHELGAIWRSTVSYHVTSSKFVGFSARTRVENWASFHSVYLYFVFLALVLTVVRGRHLWPLWLWPASALLFLFTFTPLHDNHMLVLPYSFAGAAGPALGTLVKGMRPRLAVGVVVLGGIAAAAGFTQQLHWADQLPKEDPRLVHAAQVLDRVTKPGDLVISDQAIVALLAHRRVPGEVADTSNMRFFAGTLTQRAVDRLVETKPIEALVAGRAFLAPPRLQPVILRFAARNFKHVLKLPAATIFYGRRYPPRSLSSSG